MAEPPGPGVTVAVAPFLSPPSSGARGGGRRSLPHEPLAGHDLRAPSGTVARAARGRLPSRSAMSPAASTPAARPAPPRARRRFSWDLLGRPPVLPVRLPLPDPADELPDRGRLPGRRGPPDARQPPRPVPSDHPQGLLDQPPGQRGLGARRRDHRLLPGVRGDLRRPAALGAPHPPDVLRAWPRTSPACRSPSRSWPPSGGPAW